MKPQRIQLKRTKGRKLPRGSVKVDRTTLFGNPFTVERYGPAGALTMYRAWLTGTMTDAKIEESYAPVVARHLIAKRETVLKALPLLRGKDLGCWCALPAEGEPDCCHAAFLLEFANSGVLKASE